MKYVHRTYCLFVILVIALLIIQTKPVKASPPEIKTLSVVTDDNYPPYCFRDSNGNLQGIIVDQWKLFEQKTGIKVTITGMAWNNAY